MRRGNAVGAVLAIAVLLVGACGGSAPTASESPKTPVTLNLTMHNAYKAATDQLIANLSSAYPYIEIKATYLTGGQINQIVPTQFQAGNAPDVLWMGAGTGGPVTAGTLGKAGKVLDLSNRAWVKDVAAVAPEASYNGKIYGFPVGLTPAAVFYNSQLFKQLGLTVPGTFTQLLTMCKQIRAAGKIPFALAL